METAREKWGRGGSDDDDKNGVRTIYVVCT